MGDNIESKNIMSSNENFVNNQDVNKTLNNMSSNNSLSVSDRIKLLNKAASFTSETSVKSAKSSKSTKSEKSKKKNKVKNMIKKIEKHIIHGNKKEKNDNINNEINSNPIENFETQEQQSVIIQEEKITEENNEIVTDNVVEETIEDVKDNKNEKIDIAENNTNEQTVTEKAEIEDNNESEKFNDAKEEKEELIENKEISEQKVEAVEVKEEKGENETIEKIEIIEIVEEKEEIIEDEENKEEKETYIENKENTEEKVEKIEVNDENEEKIEVTEVVEEKKESIENKEDAEEKVERVEIIEEKKESIGNKEDAEEKVESIEVVEEKKESIENKEDTEGKIEVVEEKEEPFKDKEDTEEKNETVEDKNIEEKFETHEVVEENEHVENEDVKERIETVEVVEEKEELVENNNDENSENDEKQKINENETNLLEDSTPKDTVKDYMKKDSIISQLSQVLTSDTESMSEHDTSILSVERVEEPTNYEEGSNKSENKALSSDGSVIAEEELNGFSNALKSINDINNAEKQFLIPNSEAMEEMINKSLKRNSRIDLLNIESANSDKRNSKIDLLNVESANTDKRNSYRNSFQSHQSNISNQSNQSGSNLHLQIAPPQPPPDTPLPPTPQVPAPPKFDLGEARDSDSQSLSSNEKGKTKGHLQHLSLGRLTEVVNSNDEDQQKRRSNLSSNVSIADNSTPLSSSVQMVTIQNVNESDSTIKLKKRSKNSQPLQAVVYNFDSEDDISNKEGSINEQPLQAEVETVEDKEESNSTEKPVEEENKEEDEKEKEIENTEKDTTSEPKEESVKDKADSFKTSSKKLKDTYSNIENLLEDLDNHIHNLKAPKTKPMDSQDGYEGDDEIRYSMLRKARTGLILPRRNLRNSAVTNSLIIDNPNYEISQNQRNRPVSSYNNRQSYYTDSVMNDGADVLPLPPLPPLPATASDNGPMSEMVHDINMQNVHSMGGNIYNDNNNIDDDFDIDQSLNNNLKILKSAKSPAISNASIIRKNPTPSPVISTKALKLVGVENHSIPNMSAKALKMLGMNAPNEKDEFANFQFDERELAMFNAAPTTSPHLRNNGHGRNGSNSSKPMNDEYLPYSTNEMPMNMSIEALEEAEDILLDVNEELRDSNMMSMGSIKSNNSFSSTGNNSFSVSQKAMKVFGISEHDLKSNPAIVNQMTPSTPNMNLSPHMYNIPVDNLNLSRYSINDGENQINGIISSKALKIIGLEDTSSSTPATQATNSKRSDMDGRKGIKKEKLREFEEVKEANRNTMPTLASLKPILTDNLYFNTHGILKGWKKRFTVLTQDNWIYSFNSNDPKGHAILAVPINSNTIVEEYFDPINIVPYFVEIISNWPIESETKRYVTVGCDNKQKCQSWVTSIKSLIARDKFSNAKLPPKPTLEDDLDIGNVSINPNPINSPLMNSGFRNGRPLTMSGPSFGGDLGSLYDDITGYSSVSPGGIERSHTYGDKPMTSPLMSPMNSQANIVKRPPVKNIRITKHPVRKESFKPRYASMITSPNLGAMNAMNGNRTPRLNTQTIPMVSSSPLLKGQYSPYSPVTKPLNTFNINSPNLPPMTLPSATQSSSILSTPKSIGAGYKRSPLLGAENAGTSVNTMASPILSPKQKPISMMGSPYLNAYNPNQYNAMNMMNSVEDMIDYETIQQQKMIQQEELIKQQQQQILLLQKQLLKNQQEMEQGLMDIPKDKNF